MRNKNLFLIPYSVFIILLAGIAPALAQDEGGKTPVDSGTQDWTVIKSSYAVIDVQNAVDLKSAARKIDVDFARYDPVEKKIFLERGISDAEQLANRIDILVRKAKNILDMHPQGFKINIKIYDNQDELNDAYKEIFAEEASYKAFYVHKFKTVYISLNNLSESVLAHEIGHSIIDSYFTVPPPPKIRELLACYVDLHLKD
ncbi:MAG: hypothetical protein PHI59_02915 [Candidatus Omnitrophica bacterium]|nr:hypothetical protein [Candidatus Omnitrophota bacterium]